MRNTKNTQNILHISRTMGQGGAEKVVEQLCTDLKGWRFVVASTGGYRVKTLQNHNATHYDIPDIASKNPITMLKIIKKLNSIVKKEHINIIHSHHRMAAFYARILKLKNKNLQLIYTAHNVYNDKKILSRLSISNTKIIACGKNVKDNLTKFYKISEKKVTLIPNSVKLPNVKSLNTLPQKHKNQVYLASISRLVDDKGIDIFIDALYIIKEKQLLNFHAFIFGEGEKRTLLEDKVKKNQLQQNITFLGFQEDALSLITPIDIIVSPSRREGLPLTIIELFALGKTIIASDIDSHKEIINNGFNGILFQSENIEDLAQKILKFAQNKKVLRTTAQNAKDEYLNKYNFNVFLAKYNNVYRFSNYTTDLKKIK